jgi:hypothetical protein
MTRNLRIDCDEWIVAHVRVSDAGTVIDMTATQDYEDDDGTVRRRPHPVSPRLRAFLEDEVARLQEGWGGTPCDCMADLILDVGARCALGALGMAGLLALGSLLPPVLA